MHADAPSTRLRAVDLLMFAAILVCVALVYLPVGQAQFIWDDKIAFHDAAWLRHGDDWWQYLRRGFSGWVNYFRPLVVALFTLQVRLFDVAPAPMHYVSLGLHLLNTLLVGLLALRLYPSPRRGAAAHFATAAATLLYGLHPALVEPVVWISCQYELVVTLFVLLGMHANARLAQPLLRAATVGACFFLAACAKESAVALPALLLLQDCAAQGNVSTWRGVGANVWRRQKFVYLGLVLAGIAYLALRHAALGYLVSPIGNESLWSFARLQKIAYTYVAYWRLALWPMAGLSPIHVVDEHWFQAASPASLAYDIAAATIALSGAYAFYRRHLAGVAILSFSAALFAVLNIVPVTFVESVFHERYLMTALGVICAWLPAALSGLRWRPLGSAIALGTVVVWLGLALLNIRVTLPLWSDELSLWQWALRNDPQSIVAKDHLLTEYMARGDNVRARALAGALLAEHAPCPNCILNAAYVALADGDAQRAAVALQGLQQGTALAYDARLLHGFILASGELSELQNDPAAAESAYRDAIASDPNDPSPYMRLALLLYRLGRGTEAQTTAASAVSLYAPDERERQRAILQQAAAESPH